MGFDRRGSGFWLAAAACGVVGLLVPSPGLAQRNPGPQGTSVEMIGPQVEESSEVANLVRTAEDAVSRADWKLAIDSIQRVIDEPKGLRADPNDASLYLSPRRQAYELLRALPPEGLEAYSILFDGRAKGLLEESRRSHDIEGLKYLCDHYLMTRYGPEAANLLASWLMDLGREGEAMEVLDELLVGVSARADGPGGALPVGSPLNGLSKSLMVEIELKRAVISELQGDWRRAADSVKRARELMGERGNEGTRERGDEGTRDLGGEGARGWGRVVEVEGFIAASRGAVLQGQGGAERVTEWAGFGGGGANTGVMQAVVPSFAESSPWGRSIPSVIPGVWPDLDGLRSEMLPVTHPVVADGRLFVKAGREVVAIDVESFAVLWTSERVESGVVDRTGRGATGLTIGEQDLLEDYVSQSLSTSHGLVFTIERGDVGLGFGANGLVTIVPRGPTTQRGMNPDQSNRLVALDAATGVVRWQRGRGVDTGDRMSRAQFLAPATAVGGDVWVPFESSGDLYVAVLDPADGRVRDELFLCALGGRSVNGSVALFPAVADGSVYIPTDQGMLFAVSADSRALRWASRYRSVPLPRNRNRGRGQPVSVRKTWLSGPPIVSGGVVLLAPTDADRLLAFDALTGRVLWDLPREDHRYMIAADREHLWVGGDSVSRISLGAHEYEWRRAIPETTGRAVLSGGTVYAATRSNLLAIDAETGEELEPLELPSDQAPLGNLLCLADSMISLDTSEVRSFPDRNSYDATLASHEADPRDSRTAIRLAFMELLNHRPQAALDALEGAEWPGEGGGDLQRRHLAHLRVEALMQLGGSATVSGGEAVAYLRRAVSVAESVRDRVNARISLGQTLRRVGRFKESYRTLFELACDESAVGIVGSRSVQRVARLVVADELRRIVPELGVGERAELSEEARTEVERAVEGLSLTGSSSAAVRRLQALSDSAVIDGWDQGALNALGAFAARRGKYERAEQYLRESVRRGSNRERTAEALLGLMDLYLDPAQSLHDAAGEVARRLTREFSDVRVGGAPVSSLVAARRARISDSIRTSHEAAIEPARFSLSGGDAILPIPSDEPYGLVVFRGERSESLAERMVVFSKPRTMRSYSVVDGSMEWESELRLLDDFEFNERATQGVGVGRDFLMETPTALLDGQTIVMSSARGLHAVGAITGRGLWAVPFRAGAFYGDPRLRLATTDVDGGRVACMLAPRTLGVFRAMDGKHPMEPVWTRNTGTGAVRAVRIRDGMVLTAGPSLEAVRVYDSETGVALSEIEFHQPEEGDLEIPLAYAEGVLCGPDGSSIVGYDARSGERLWSLALPEVPVSMFEPVEGKLVVGTDRGYHRLVETRTGDVVFEAQYDELRGGAIDGVLESGVLVLSGMEETTEGFRWRLVGVDLEASGRGDGTPWTCDLIGTLTGPQLDVASGVIPVVAMVPIEGFDVGRVDGRVPNTRYRQAIMLIDKRTGETIGEPLQATMHGDRLTGELAVWPGRLVLQTTKGVVTYATTVSGRPRGGSGGVD